MWGCFEATYRVLMQDAVDYLSDTMGFLDNCINFGADFLSTSTDHRRFVLELFDMAMTNRALGAEDRVIACKLAETLLLRLHGQVDEVSLPRLSLCRRPQGPRADGCGLLAGNPSHRRARHDVCAVDERRR